MVVVGDPPTPVPPPHPPVSVVVLDEVGSPLPGAQVSFQGVTTEADQTGAATTVWNDEPISVSAAAPGFHAAEAIIEQFSEEPLEVSLEPVVLTGRVTNATGDGIGGARVRIGELEAVSGPTGSFRLERAVPGEGLVTRPA